MAANKRTRSERIEARRAAAFPIENFSTEKQAEIWLAMQEPTPPHKWIYFGVDGDSKPLAAIISRAWYEWHWERGIDPDTKRDPLPKRLRQAVIDRDGYVCQICGGDVEAVWLHVDHIKPWSKGGRHELSNLQVTHSWCNLRKGARY